MLSQEQMRFFHHFGYLHLPALFSPAEMVDITANFERTMALVNSAAPEPGPRVSILGPIQHLPEMNRLLDHPAILGLAGDILGPDFSYVCGDGNFYAGDTHWHPDGSWEQLFACKIAIYLDPLTRATGALRVVPGSHDPGHPIRRHKLAQLQECGVHGRDLPGAEALETTPGDVVFFNHDTYHSSWGGRNGRRMFTMNLVRHCSTPAEMELLRQYVSVHSPAGHGANIGGLYFTPLVETASESRMSHLRQPATIYDEIFPQCAARMSHQQQMANLVMSFRKRLAPAEPKAEATAEAVGA